MNNRRSIEDTVARLVNAEEIKEWVFLFEQKMQKEKLRNSKYMNLYKNKPLHYQFVEEDEKLNEIQAIEKIIEKESNKKINILKKYQAATEKNNEKLMKKLENQIVEIDKKIACLRILIDDKKEEVKNVRKTKMLIINRKSKK